MKLFFYLSIILLFSISFAQAQDITQLCATQKGRSSYYNDNLHGHLTSSGVPYDKTKLSAAHRTLAFGTLVEVTNISNKQTVKVVVTDRGPYADSRIIDLSRAAAQKIGMIQAGTAPVKIKVLRLGYDGEQCSDMKPKKVLIKETTYEVSEKAITYNLWGEKSIAGGYGILVGETSELAEAVKIGAKSYREGFKQTFILADQAANEQYLFRVIVGQDDKKAAGALGQQLAQKGFKNISLVSHK